LSKKNHQPGVGIDAYGGGVLDPTPNVLRLIKTSSKRHDDLREALIGGVKDQISHLKEVAVIRDRHAEEMRVSEAARLDSIRQVDVTAVRTEASRALEAIQTLAATSARDAETLRNLVNSTALTTAAGNADTVKQIVERIAALERSSYEGVGKQRVIDPQMAELLAEVKGLSQARRTNEGVGQGINMSWVVFVGAMTLAVAIVGTGILLIGRAGVPVAASPTVVYVPTLPAPVGAPRTP
jgi:hypothetical protein